MPDIALVQHQSTPARIEVRGGPARLSIENPPAQLQVDSSGGGIEIQSTPGQLSIDSTAARASMHYYSMLGLLGEIVAYSGRQLERGVSDTVAAGDQLQAVENGGSPVKSLAFERMFVDYNDRQFTIGLMPSTPPQISYQRGNLSIRARGGTPRLQIRANKPIIQVEPQRSEISVSRSALRMSIAGQRLNIVA